MDSCQYCAKFNVYFYIKKVVYIKDIIGYEGLYKIDKFGNIYSYQTKKIRKIKPWIDSKNKYYQIGLNKNGKRKKFLIHRLIAIHFIENPNNYDVVHHIDGNTQNNCLSNLKWTTQQNNIHESYETMSSVRNFIEVYLLKNNKIIGKFKSKEDAAKYAEKFNIKKSMLLKYNKYKNYTLKKCKDYSL